MFNRVFLNYVVLWIGYKNTSLLNWKYETLFLWFKMTEVEKKGIGKAKAGLVVCAVLVVILAVSNVWSYTALFK